MFTIREIDKLRHQVFARRINGKVFIFNLRELLIKSGTNNWDHAIASASLLCVR